VTGRIPGSDDDSTLILAVRNQADASAEFEAQMYSLNDVSEEDVAFLTKQYGSSIFVVEAQEIGQAANGFVRVADSNLLWPAGVQPELDETSRALIDHIPDGVSDFTIQYYDDSGMFELIAHVGDKKHHGAIKDYYAEREQAGPAPAMP